MPSTTNNLIACGECDLLQREPRVEDGGRAECVRCGAELFRERDRSLDMTLAFVVSASIVFLLANAYPLINLDAKGIRTSATLFDTAWALQERGMSSIALLVFVTVIAAPATYLAAMLYLLIPMRLGIRPRYLHNAFRVARLVQPWGMVEVFLLGAMVSMVKLTQVAKVDADIGIFCVGAYVLLVAGAMSAFEPHELWQRAEELGLRLPAAQGANP
ncbi:MAG: paraquat-inducible protein A [Burkholderiales bacterium]|nr:paraquat-inducible protein A [Burkholderiales bacterium]